MSHEEWMELNDQLQQLRYCSMGDVDDRINRLLDILMQKFCEDSTREDSKK